MIGLRWFSVRARLLLAVVPVALVMLAPAPAQAEGGDMSTCVVKNDRTVWCWGWISGMSLPTATPVQVAGINDAKAVSGPMSFVCALRATGAVACWGSNYDGQLGDGTNDRSDSPVAVSGLNDAVALDVGERFACAVRVTGAVVCWGYNENGELGDGTTTSSNVPIEVLGISGANDASSAVAVSVGERHACALLVDGAAKCWGNNESGELGNGTTDDSTVPVAVSGSTDLTEIAAGPGGTCALHVGGTVSCWGTNMAGLLGTGSEDPFSSLPVVVPGINSAVSVSAPGYKRCALLVGHQLKCWGAVDPSILVTGDISKAATTPQTMAGFTDIAYVLDGMYTTCVVKLNGKVACSGIGLFGLLGNGQSVLAAGPDRPVQGLTDATALDLGGVFGCALRTTKQIECWGVGPFGPGATSERQQTSIPASVPGATDVESFSVGESHGCAVIVGGTVDCLGNGNNGRLGNGSDSDSYLAAVSVGGITDAIGLATGGRHSCALLAGGSVKCWGHNREGQLGDGTNNSASTPQSVSGLSGVTQIAAGNATTCALVDGAVWCWGELNDVSNTSSSVPVEVPGITTATQIAVGRTHSCAVLDDKTAVCWGRNYDGQLGDGTETDSSTPVPVAGLSDVRAIGAGGADTCAVLEDGTVRCWGEMTQMAHGGEGAPATFAVPGVTTAASVSVGEMATCARLANGTASCWVSTITGSRCSVTATARSGTVRSGRRSMSSACPAYGQARPHRSTTTRPTTTRPTTRMIHRARTRRRS